MTVELRRNIIICLGIVSGLAAWPVYELVLFLHKNFASHTTFNIVLGGSFSLTLGLFFGARDGIVNPSGNGLVTGVFFGAILGFAGGALGFLAAHLAQGSGFGATAEDYKSFGLPLTRTIGWTVAGLFVGAADGVRSRSGTNLKIGILGGLLGGLIGGLVAEFIQASLPYAPIARLIGVLTIGLLIGFFIAVFEKSSVQGVFKLLNGKQRGKEFPLIGKKFDVGKAGKSQIPLSAYVGAMNLHAQVTAESGQLTIHNKAKKKPIQINNEVVEDQRALNENDVIQVGTAKLLFLTK